MAESPPDRVPIADLPNDERERVEQFDVRTDEIAGLRSELAAFYGKYRKYLASGEAGEGKRGRPRVRVEEFVASQRAATDTFTATADSVRDIIDWAAVDADADALAADQPPAKRAAVRRLHRLRVTGAFLRAAAVANDLQRLWEAPIGTELVGDPDALRQYYRARWGEFGKSVSTLDGIRAKIAEIDSVYDLAASDPEFALHPDDLKELATERDGFLADAQELVRTSPEAYLAAFGRELHEAKAAFDAHGRIVETPYVKAKLARMREYLASGRPVFVHGELGSGKTELAKHLARTTLSQPHLVRWERANPRPEDPTALAAWEARRSEEAEALVISGHKGIEVTQILASRAIERKEAPPPEEQVRAIAARWDEFRKTLPEGVDIDRFRDVFERAHLEAFRAPIETKGILAPFLRAMREGRPIIVDEMNAIPHHVLIVLNDLLTRRPGDMVAPPFADMEPFPVAEGFAVIATGNYKLEDGKLYVGRQQIDAAFLSRWGIVPYDYLPNAREREADALPPEEQRARRRQNELLMMLVVRLLDGDLSATLPEDTFRQLENLALVSRTLQDAFSGGDVPDAYFYQKGTSKLNPKEVLKENVLSLRHLIPILDRWKREGFSRPLDDYLFAEYIARSSARPEEQLYLYKILNVQGDFFKGSGWPDVDERQHILQFPIDARMHAIDRVTGAAAASPKPVADLHRYSAQEVIAMLYGPPPERTSVSRKFLDRPAARAESDGGAIDPEERLARERWVEEMLGALKRAREEGYFIGSK